MDFEEILREAEEQQILQQKRIYTSMLNQPALVGVNSTDRVITQSQDAFSSFQVNLPRPALEVDAVQLVNANIPQCNPNIPDTACGFWYYRLNAYSGDIPSVNNLHWVRLLPSYYKKELITDPQLYGYNETFASYPDVATQLDLSCKQDLANSLWTQDDTGIEKFYKSQYLPYDITLTYDAGANKFQMTGLNTWKPPAYAEWLVGATYAVGDKVYYDDPTNTYIVSYTCIQANTGQQPNTTTGYWVEDNQPIVAEWENTLTYQQNRIVEWNGVLYISTQNNNTNHQPDTSIPTWWEAIISGVGDFVWNRYLITGFSDPNVAKLQGRCYRPYDDVTLFELDDVVDYNGTFYQANKQTLGAGIPSADWVAKSTPIQQVTNTGPQVRVRCDTTFFAAVPMGTPVYIVGNSNQEFNLLPSTDFAFYENTYTFQTISGDEVILNGDYFDVDTPSVIGLGGRICLEVAPDIGLFALSGQYDFTLQAVQNIPPQPFAPNPKRLLNSILGFTWNGVFTLAQFKDYSNNEPLIISFVNTNLFNRMRPVPQYLTQPIGILDARPPPLSQDAAVVTSVYTADGYCNLVYSSIINIYCSVVYGSTTDTTRNTNLIAIGTMNCGNLGVSYFNPIVVNPLRIRGDVYALEFQFYDECGDPYVFTNNAVVTLGLKFDYKKLRDEKVM